MTSLRSRMFEVKCNFRGKYFNLNCRFKCPEEETQQHIFRCEKIRDKMSANVDGVEYEHLFATVKKQKKVVEKFEIIQNILEDYPI